jgi:hypothetical protein
VASPNRTIDASFYRALDDTFYMLTQQKPSRLESRVSMKSGIRGKSYDVNRLDATEAYDITSANADTIIIEQPFSRRRMNLLPRAWAAMLDDFDEVMMLTDPQSPYTGQCLAALNRKKDFVIAASMLGTATTVGAADDTTGGYSTVSLPSSGGPLGVGQVIANGGTGLTVDKLRQAMAILDSNEFPAEERFFAWSPVAKMQLLRTTEATSADYNTVKALVGGSITSFMGFDFVTFGTKNPGSAALPKSGNIRQCIAWHRSAVRAGFGLINNQIRVSERPDKNNNWQVLGKLLCGAVRLDEYGVVEVDIDETK